jgi:type I restriction enzyme, S subunit
MSEAASETEWTLPQSWAWSRMGEVASVIGGGTPRTDDPSNYEGGEIAWITPADLSGYTHKYIQRGARNITQRGLENSGARTMPAGTVLFSSRAPIGYVAIAANPLSTNQGFKSFVLPEDLSPDYIYYYLQRAKEIARGLASGTTFLEISGAKATIIPVPIAPRPEQDRIVAEIEKQFTRLDDAVAALKRVQANLKRYRASVLKAACEGRLVPTEAELARKENRDYEPASELLKRILAERRAKWEAAQLQKMIAAGKLPTNDEWKSRYKEPQPPKAISAELPEGWLWASVEQISTKVTDGVHKKPNYVESGVPFVTVKNLTAGPGISFDNLNYVTKTDHEEFVKRANPEAGDILISKDGTLGVVRAIRTAKVFSIFVSVAMIKPAFCELTDYLEFALCCPQVQIQMVPKGSGLQHIHLEDLREDCVPLPPLEEQQRIVDACSRQISVIDALEAEVEKRYVHAAALRRSILRAAFSGQLVPQDPNDEPASVLLERVRAERAALATNNGNQKATPEAGTANGQRRRRITRLAHRVSGGKGLEK